MWTSIDPGIATISAATIGILFSANTVFFRWLISSFNQVRNDIKHQTEKSFQWLDDHERKDQDRHEENLYRFEKISVALAKLGVENGTAEKHGKIRQTAEI